MPYNGEFSLRLAHPFRQGAWILGDGRGPSQADVDILLAAPRTVRSIAGEHALIFFHSQMGRLLLRAHHKGITPLPIYAGTSFVLNKDSDPRTLELKSRQEINIGGYSYLFTYTEVAQSAQYHAHHHDFMRRFHNSDWESINALRAGLLNRIPDEQAVRLGRYSWSVGAFAAGTFGQFVAGTSISGEAIAVKKLKRPRSKSLKDIHNLMAHIGSHDHIVQLLEAFANMDAAIPEAYCFYRPFCVGTLFDTCLRGIPLPKFMRLAHHYFDALTFLHDTKHVMHRDIKPANLGVQQLEPSHGVILDLDDAIIADSSTDHKKGTLEYLAPEVVALKDEALKQQFAAEWELTFSGTYGPKNDCWAMGMSLYHGFVKRYHRGLITPEYVEKFGEDVQQRAESDSAWELMARISLSLIVVDPDARWSAGEAVAALDTILGPPRKRPAMESIGD